MPKKVIILGASSGIGKELAKIFIEEGWQVGLGARRRNLMKDLKKQAPDRVFIRHINVNNKETRLKRIHELISDMGGLDVFILSSAVGYSNTRLQWSQNKETVETNVMGFTAIVGNMFKYFKKQGYGHLAAVTSVAGTRGLRYAPAYSASKAYQAAFLEALRHKSKHEKHHVVVTDIRPGFVDTPFIKTTPNAFWTVSPQKVATKIVKGLEKQKPYIYIPYRWRFVAFILKNLPLFIYKQF